MAGRAIWRTLPSDPRTFLGWALRDVRAPVRFAAERLGWTLRTVAFLLLGHGNPFPAALLFAFSYLPESIVDSVADAFRSLRPPLPVTPLLALPPPATPFPCRVEVHQRGTLIGADVGIVSFVEGWLQYEGLRTAFSLRHADVERREGDALILPGRVTVAFAPEDALRAEGLVERDLRPRFRANLVSWTRSESPVGVARSPSRGAHATGYARAWNRMALCLTLGVALMLVGAAAKGEVGAGLLAWPFVLGLFEAIRDLRRLERLEAPELDGVIPDRP